ncbi:MAG TPA: MFS transporter [Nocardioidaceae bacterium]|nr:MFS transporter [Nocardioidaceae bacterium]
MPPPDQPEERRWLTRGVASVGSASFFSDAGHELATSLLPTFLTSTLHSGPAALGAIDGAADALMGLSKLAGGPLANDPARRARLASSGYLGTAVATALIGLTAAVWQVGVLRTVAWVSRGIRGPARDSLLMSLAPRSAYGRAAGVERAGDNAGAIAGPLLASLLVGIIGIRHAILVAIVPGVLAAVAITVAARQARATAFTPPGRRTLRLNLGELRRAGLVKALTPPALFELGNLATTLLILRATDLLHTGGRSLTAATSLAIILYAVHNAAGVVAALVGGQLIDRVSPRLVFASGAGVYVVGYAMFALDRHAIWWVAVGFILAGVGIGFGETAESATVALMLPDRLRGNGFGVLGLVQSMGDLGATVVAGVLWATVSATAAFVYAAAWMAASLLSSGLLRSVSGRTAPGALPHG